MESAVEEKHLSDGDLTGMKFFGHDSFNRKKVC